MMITAIDVIVVLVLGVAMGYLWGKRDGFEAGYQKGWRDYKAGKERFWGDGPPVRRENG